MVLNRHEVFNRHVLSQNLSSGVLSQNLSSGVLSQKSEFGRSLSKIEFGRSLSKIELLANCGTFWSQTVPPLCDRPKFFKAEHGNILDNENRQADILQKSNSMLHRTERASLPLPLLILPQQTRRWHSAIRFATHSCSLEVPKTQDAVRSTLHISAPSHVFNTLVLIHFVNVFI